MYVLIFIVLLLVLIFGTFRLPAFGGTPSGRRRQRIESQPNYADGALNNLSYTPVKPPEVSYLDMIRGMLKKNADRKPPGPVPVEQPDFSPVEGVKLTWFGHSSYLVQVGEGGVNRNILIDPVFSTRTSPFSFLGTSNYPGTDFMVPEALPELDVVLITHDHYDHMDYRTLLQLKGKARRFIVSLGVGVHLEKWNIPAERITELAWYESLDLDGLGFTALPARHFSGRKFKRNQTAWSAFVLEAAGYTLYLGGDSGYDTHFAAAGEVYGPFDLAVLECGQYNAYWPHIHMFPEETVRAALDLRAKALMPVHWGKFTLAMHDWDEPVRRAAACAAEKQLPLVTPLMGAPVILGAPFPQRRWWEDLRKTDPQTI
ncbi:MBL fold metallo-hydrolase [Pedobacter sp. JY14-1]|uniref:MBL fold metallo-hydrolase n=1 Tax=Pedobacter sp. JY14-1 TaxID=3034151 RepID=UPI0023E139E6|nr:MBL fold metallo-hydrolase [Pedobacter sp. JY14-1]